MQDETTPEPQLEKYETLEREALYTLTNPDRHPTIYALADLGRELETHDPVAVIRPLLNAGLLHKTSDDCVFATPAAFRWVELVGHVS
jgi:hypothetical protein